MGGSKEEKIKVSIRQRISQNVTWHNTKNVIICMIIGSFLTISVPVVSIKFGLISTDSIIGTLNLLTTTNVIQPSGEPARPLITRPLPDTEQLFEYSPDKNEEVMWLVNYGEVSGRLYFESFKSEIDGKTVSTPPGEKSKTYRLFPGEKKFFRIQSNVYPEPKTISVEIEVKYQREDSDSSEFPFLYAEKIVCIEEAGGLNCASEELNRPEAP